MKKCRYCNSCLKIKRVNFSDRSTNYFVCDFCGRIYQQTIGFPEENPEDSDFARKYLDLEKVGTDAK